MTQYERWGRYLALTLTFLSPSSHFFTRSSLAQVIPGIAAEKGGGGLFGCCKKGMKNLNVYNPDEIEELDDVQVSPGNERTRSAGRERGLRSYVVWGGGAPSTHVTVDRVSGGRGGGGG